MKEATATHEGLHPPEKSRKLPGRRRRPFHDLGEGASTEAKRLAAAILEVLAGTRTPTEAAQVLGMALPRYYLLELRALHGMLVACEPRNTERGPAAPSALQALERECAQLRRECGRQQALVRAAQRAIGLPPPPPPLTKAGKNGTKRRRRRPTARALRAAARLQPEGAGEAPAPAVVQEAP